MKKIFFIAFVILYAQLQAQVRIDEREAFSVAECFLKESTKWQSPTIALSETINSEPSGQTNLYVFSIAPQGFVVVSALGDILAYSLNSEMPRSNALPDHIRYWLNLYNEATDRLITHPVQRKEPTKSQTAVEPLLTSCWGQGCYHNEACPYDSTGPCQHVEAGCVAIAMAQIMYYHKAPQKGIGTMTYFCPPYGSLTADFENTYYQWESMADTLFENNQAVATLISHCGISVKMKYSHDGSGAYSQDVPDALHRYFYYPAASYSKRVNYDDEQWQKIIRNNLDERHPVYYAGTSNLGRHAFVCDGYDDNGKFHFNFGWDGVADGYYTLTSPYGFSGDQSIICDIFPIDEISLHSDSHGIIYVAPDGTGDGSSWEQATSELQLALFKSTTDSSSIWVKEGIYRGDPEMNFAFTPLFKCSLYGGFKGDEPYDYDLSQRDFEAHPSILDGSQAQGVIGGISSNDLIVIDGFTIQNGNAMNGGGILLESDAQIRNCKFCHNHASFLGGAVYQQSLAASRTFFFENCEFFDNEAFHGGAIYDYGNTSFFRCIFHDNHAQNNGGGVFCITEGSPSQFINCTINNNTAKNGGGITISTNRGPTLWNCLIKNNTAENGGGCYITRDANLYNCTIVRNEATAAYGGISSNNQANIKNCIVWGNTDPNGDIQIGPFQTHTYCAVQNDFTATGNNFCTTPENDGDSTGFYIRFIDPIGIAGSTGYGGDWRLQPNSLCVDLGDAIAGQPDFDMDENPRFKHRSVDIGAYESNTASQFIEEILCEVEPYYYQDSLIPDVGYYSFFYHDNLHDSIVILHMLNPAASVFYEEEICENETFDFFGVPLAEAGVYHKTIDCITYELTLNLKPLDSIYIQEEICKNETFDFFGTPLNEAGTYYKTTNCVFYKLDLDVKPSSNLHMEETICEGETYNFLGHSLNEGGYYTETIDCRSYELDLTVNPVPTLLCSNDTLVKRNSPVFLNAFGADSYLWSTGDTTNCITIFPKEDKTYSVTGFSKSGCESTAKVRVTIDNSDDGHTKDEIALFPNPANDNVIIYAPLIDEVEVFNTFGVSIEKTKAERNAVILDVSHYTNGVYIIHIKELNNHKYRKLVIQH